MESKGVVECSVTGHPPRFTWIIQRVRLARGGPMVVGRGVTLRMGKSVARRAAFQAFRSQVIPRPVVRDETADAEQRENAGVIDLLRKAQHRAQ